MCLFCFIRNIVDIVPLEKWRREDLPYRPYLRRGGKIARGVLA